MRMTVALTVLIMAATVWVVDAQLTVGPSGLSTPPINLLSVFRFVRDFVMAIMFPDTTSPAKTQPAAKEEPGTPATTKEAQQKVLSFVRDDHTNGNIVEKFDSGCVEDGSGACLDASNHLRREEEGGLLLQEEEEEAAEEKTSTSQLVAGKWPLAYITFITITFWLFVLVATPYIITGETYTRSDDHVDSNALIDQQDVLLLLAWLLGEASNDKACLERVVCLTPTKSSRYISVSSMVFNVASFLRRWVPYSPRYVDLLRHLDDITQDGFSQSCHKYYCPTVPEL
ncbi:uncharacterized protein [Panulirus ornatus]|uniref:uncharacterized protein isoform X1 n=1 Tax=Panulirus ornatus TaxID=150431 RepID=UPI003A88129E